MRRRRSGRLVGAAAVAVLAGVGSLAGLAPAAGAATASNLLVGEGDSFLSPLVHQLISDSSGHLSGLTGSYQTTDFTSISDFTGSAPNDFAADFAVSERALTSTELAGAKAHDRNFVYVPFAATPVAVGTIVPDSDYSGGNTLTNGELCPHIQMTVQDLAAVWGIDGTNPVQYWNDPRFTCANGKALYHQSTTTAGNLDPSMANLALMTYLDSDPTAKSYFQAGVDSAKLSGRATSTSITPSEELPYSGTYFIPGGDQPFIGKLILVNATTNAPTWDPANDAMGASFPVSSIWTGQPLGAPWNIPTASLENAAGKFVFPSTTSAIAAENDATLAQTSDPTTNNLVTFNASATDAAAYNNDMMVESYLLVPTNGLVGAKAAAMADLIRFVVGAAGQRDIESFGAAPATSAMVTADLSVAAQLDTEAAQSGTTTSSTTPGSSTSTTAAPGSTGAGGSGDTGAGDTSGGGGTGASSPALAFTGGPDLAPLLGTGAALLFAGGLVRWRLRRRARRRVIGS